MTVGYILPNEMTMPQSNWTHSGQCFAEDRRLPLLTAPLIKPGGTPDIKVDGRFVRSWASVRGRITVPRWAIETGGIV